MSNKESQDQHLITELKLFLMSPHFIEFVKKR